MVGGGLTISALSTFAVPFAVKSLPFVIALRVICGLGEAAAAPGGFHIIAHWFPKAEKVTAYDLVCSPFIATLIQINRRSAVIPTGAYFGIVYGMV